MIKTDDYDNQIIMNYVYTANKKLPIEHKVAMNCKINSITFDTEGTWFNYTIIEPIYNEEAGVIEKNVTINEDEIGTDGTICIDNFEKPISDALKAAVREIKIRNLGI